MATSTHYDTATHGDTRTNLLSPRGVTRPLELVSPPVSRNRDREAGIGTILETSPDLAVWARAGRCQYTVPLNLTVETMKEVQLTQGLVALVDDEDYERVSEYNWHAIKSTNGRTVYARTHIFWRIFKT